MAAKKTDDDSSLKRLGGGRWQTRDERFTIEPQSGTWVLVDGEQTDDLGLPLVRGPFRSLTEAKAAVEAARGHRGPGIAAGRSGQEDRRPDHDRRRRRPPERRSAEATGAAAAAARAPLDRRAHAARSRPSPTAHRAARGSGRSRCRGCRPPGPHRRRADGRPGGPRRPARGVAAVPPRTRAPSSARSVASWRRSTMVATKPWAFGGGSSTVTGVPSA